MVAKNRIKSLDGVRGVFIIFVIIGHALETLPYAFAQDHTFSFFMINIGSTGVRIFFAMSGYLITKLLMLEQEKTGKVDLKDFYIRRTFRIFPTFFLYIFVILLLKWTIVPDIFTDYSLILFAIFYLWNYKQLFTEHNFEDKGNWFLGHFWSLSMEEQFYLLWPFTFVKFRVPILIKIIISILLVMPLIRVVSFVAFEHERLFIDGMLHTGGDTILIGCLLALIEQSENLKNKMLHYFSQPWLIFTTATLLFVISPLLKYKFQAAYNMSIGMSLNNVCIVILLYWAMYIPSKTADFLNMKFISKLGVASYSLYVWQQLFLTTKNDFWLNKFPQNIIAVIVVGLGSHYFIENPILKLKNRFKKV